MRTFLGIDLGSTMTKAVLVDEAGSVVGRGLTNTRANFETACSIARAEAETDARFTKLQQRRGDDVNRLRARYRQAERQHRLSRLRRRCESGTGVDALFSHLDSVVDASDIAFREAVLGAATAAAEGVSEACGIAYESLMGALERALVADEADPEVLKPEAVLEELAEEPDPIEIVGKAGTGYGRHRLPFEEREIRSEILCHGLGAHRLFPHTKTVLDIGGQDTKAIQLDEEGLVTSFQMNDRCAAGCGRYLGYVAEELGIMLPELAPLALCSSCPSQINSTCTVFAGAEIRDRMALGEKREDVVAGLHRAIVLRALGLLARSGGVKSELTFSGGVARNEAVVGFLRQEIARHYSAVTINVSPESIFCGALGAALFARMEAAC